MRKPILLIAGALLILGAAVALYLLTRPRVSDAAQIKQMLLQAQGYVNRRDVRRLMTLVSEDYDDGNYYKEDLRNLVKGIVNPTYSLEVILSLKDLEVQDTTATATLFVQVTFGADHYTYDPLILKLHKERGKWLVTSATGWEKAQEDLPLG